MLKVVFVRKNIIRKTSESLLASLFVPFRTHVWPSIQASNTLIRNTAVCVKSSEGGCESPTLWQGSHVSSLCPMPRFTLGLCDCIPHAVNPCVAPTFEKTTGPSPNSQPSMPSLLRSAEERDRTARPLPLALGSPSPLPGPGSGTASPT